MQYNRYHVWSTARALPFIVLACCLLIITGTGKQIEASPAKVVQLHPSGAVPDHYIVVLNDQAPAPGDAAKQMAAAHGLKLGFVYKYALKGFSFSGSAAAARALAGHRWVKYVEQDRIAHIFAQSTPTGVQRIFANANGNIGIDGTDDKRVDVDVAVIDTGVDFQHPDLNVVGGVNCSGGSPLKGSCGPGGDDDHYHGTHVAGTIGALDNGFGVVGVAPGARIWAVKVLKSNGSGYLSWIVAGLDWVTANADTIEVANMSLGGSGFSQAEYDAIQGAVNAGVAFAVAAGNSDDDASKYSPAGFDNVLTVSALADFDGASGGNGSPTCRTDQDDTLADFSNWGSAVDIAAPGVCILSTFPIEQGEYGTISGTSMASPHVAGALALLASVNSPKNATDVQNLYNQLLSTGNFNWEDDSGDGSKEPLLDVSSFDPTMIEGSGGSSVTNDPPVVSITSPGDNTTFASGELIYFAGSASDTEDGNLTSSLVWTSSINGQIAEGGSFSTTLSDGTHTITASTTDNSNATGSASIKVTVGTPPIGANMVNVDSIAYTTEGGKHNDRHLLITVALSDDQGNPVSGASVSIELMRNGSLVAQGTGTTGTDGTVTFTLKNAPSGTYKTDVTDVTASGLTWDGVTPSNSFTK